jgi:hypothetical protein
MEHRGVFVTLVPEIVDALGGAPRSWLQGELPMAAGWQRHSCLAPRVC